MSTKDHFAATAEAFGRSARALPAVVAAVGALASAGASSALARAPFDAHLHAPGHHPRAGHKWPITVTARSWAGRPLSGRIRYEFVYGGRVVARRSNYAFRGGRFHDRDFSWPARSAGIALTLRVVVSTKRGTVRLPYDVVVAR